MPDTTASLTFLFTDIEGSTRLWDESPVAMRAALARHDALILACIQRHGGWLVKSTGDGVHAAFPDPAQALCASIEFQLELAAPGGGHEGGNKGNGNGNGNDDNNNGAQLMLRSRCGLHSGYDEQRGGDYFGSDVNRAARIMQAAHGGQILLSKTVADALAPALPAGWALLPLGRVRLRGLRAPEDLYQVCAPGLPANFPALRNLAETPHNLPAPLTSFIGREKELGQLQGLLARARLVTLQGLGGLGKTRLALELARRVLNQFPDGVWFIELAHVSDPALVPSALAHVLGVKEEPERPLLDTLARHVAERQLLVLLDNCEHLVDACAQVAARLLGAGSALKCLVTSRERLRITGEVCVDVVPLSVPSAREVPSLDALRQLDAVRLFVERVQAVRPDFELDLPQAQAVAQICQRLDGIPLALELAAACTRTMPLATLCRRLDDRFRLLVQGDRSALPRQRTLRALIDWSHDLLGPSQRSVFYRVSVFAGGWTLEAAEAVCGGSLAVPEVLTELAEKSLVQVDLASGRYSMLETVREYAQERLRQDGLLPATAQAQARYFLDFAQAARARLGSPDQADWLQRLDTDRDNLLAAHKACAEVPAGDRQRAQLCHALKPYWLSRGLLGLGLRLSTEALQGLEGQPADETQLEALFGVGQLCFYAGQYERARAYLERCHAMCQKLGNQRLEIAALQPLGMAYLGLNEPQRATDCLETALVLARQATNTRFEAFILNGLAQLHRARGHAAQAREFNAQALQLAHRHGDMEMVAIAHLNDAMLHLDAGDSAPAGALLLGVVDRFSAGESLALVQSALEVATGLAADGKDWSHAARFYAQAEALARQSGLRRDPADERFLAPRIARIHQVLGGATLHHLHETTDAPTPEQATSQLSAWLNSAADTPAHSPVN